MQIILYILLAFGLVGGFASLVCVVAGTDLSELMPVYKPRKKIVGPLFWGNYNEAPKDEAGMEQIKLPKISEFDNNPIIGSEVYSKGKAVRSLRR